MKRHVPEIVAAILLCLAVFFSYAARVPISLPLVGTGSVAVSSPDDFSADLVAVPMLHIRWPQFPNFGIGLCTNEEYTQ